MPRNDNHGDNAAAAAEAAAAATTRRHKSSRDATKASGTDRDRQCHRQREAERERENERELNHMQTKVNQSILELTNCVKQYYE